MKFTLDWLLEHLDTSASPTEIGETLTKVGLELEGMEDQGKALSAFVTAHVVSAEQHPNADKLRVCKVDAGTGELIDVVCGAPNARTGLKSVFAFPGTYIPGKDMTIGKGNIRGQVSNGMLCSNAELELSNDHDGIIELPADAPIGIKYTDYAGIGGVVFDISITPNRGDATGVYGIARDLAAFGLGTLKTTDMSPVASRGKSPIAPLPQLFSADEPKAIRKFAGRYLKGISNGPSPAWLQQRLRAVGLRPINTIVDITNWVSLGWGRPLHAYDADKLNGQPVLRNARNEAFDALDNKVYTLDETMTVIADDAGVHDIAGIMGGEHSGVTADTTDVLLEIAFFDPERIGITGRKLGLTSDARTRFERGVDPAFLDEGLAILTDLILRICGGTPSEVVRAGQPPIEPKVIAFDPSLTQRLGGVAIDDGEQRRILEALDFRVSFETPRTSSSAPQDERGNEKTSVRAEEGLKPQAKSPFRSTWQVTCPPRRHDIEGPADLVEEVVRIHGLDKVTSTPLARADGVAKPTATPLQQTERKLRRTAAARGLNEAVTWSFLPEADADHFVLRDAADAAPQDDRVSKELWVLDNPISEDMKAMRPSLIPGLLAAAKRNADRGASASRLFEIGRRYLRGDGGASDERPTLGVILAGHKAPRGWAAGKATGFDAYDAKAEALALLEAAGAPVANLQVMGEAGAQFHPGQSATLRLGPKTVLARFGALHPATLKVFDVDGPVMAVELFLDAIPAKKAGGFARAAYTPPALQAVTRDFAFLVPTELAA